MHLAQSGPVVEPICQQSFTALLGAALLRQSSVCVCRFLSLALHGCCCISSDMALFLHHSHCSFMTSLTSWSCFQHKCRRASPVGWTQIIQRGRLRFLYMRHNECSGARQESQTRYHFETPHCLFYMSFFLLLNKWKVFRYRLHTESSGRGYAVKSVHPKIS